MPALFLSAVLKRVQSEIQHVGRKLSLIKYAGYTAFFAEMLLNGKNILFMLKQNIFLNYLPRTRRISS